MTHYETLGVKQSATAAEIKAAWQKLVKEWHPDKQRPNSDASTKKKSEEMSRCINEAWEILGNAAKKKKYDESLASDMPKASGGGSQVHPIEDIDGGGGKPSDDSKHSDDTDKSKGVRVQLQRGLEKTTLSFSGMSGSTQLSELHGKNKKLENCVFKTQSGDEIGDDSVEIREIADKVDGAWQVVAVDETKSAGDQPITKVTKPVGVQPYEAPKLPDATFTGPGGISDHNPVKAQGDVAGVTLTQLKNPECMLDQLDLCNGRYRTSDGNIAIAPYIAARFKPMKSVKHFISVNTGSSSVDIAYDAAMHATMRSGYFNSEVHGGIGGFGQGVS
eukprot:CAMPEP_0202728610 /NCGR_PEP_ID=MMETSP1385-20130828/185715_1 /ASSEMBLY_ACC=CAM_ASM_000861 /TAXON_ID=933848 /ORGANISM="Elphidium margaritaceum" /LENGTH=331 /DNA_ID=CAMNT_0049394861 /DNA_START=22 /DNA_END=1014 /DNA_ORIENTATION=+